MMKKLLRLLYLLVFIFLGYNYFQNNEDQAMRGLAVGEEWVNDKSDGLKVAFKTLKEKEINIGSTSNIISTDRKYVHLATKVHTTVGKSNTAVVKSEYRSTYQSFISKKCGGAKSVAREKKIDISETPAELITKDLGVGQRKENIEWVKAMSKKYSPDTWQMLMEYEALPIFDQASLVCGGTISSEKSVSTFSYLEGNSQIELLASMKINVHELAHAYFTQKTYDYSRKKNILLDWDKVEGYIFIAPVKHYFVSYPKKTLFPSNRLNKVIPSSLISYRYKNYINGKSSTQNHGIIGLLNEFHAYYLGSKYNFDMLRAYQNTSGSDAVGLLEWVGHTTSSMTAFYEFDFFIKEYLLYLQEHDEATYRLLRDTGEFKDAYRTIYAYYEKLTRAYFTLIQTEIERINTQNQQKCG